MANFSEVKLFSVRPDRVSEFEGLAADMLARQAERPGCEGISVVKRFYTYTDSLEKPPRELTKIVKCVKYYATWRFSSMEAYHEATQWFFAEYGKSVMKLLIAPFDINCGYEIE